MASTIQIKRSAVNDAPSSLRLGEMAYSWSPTSNKLFIGTGSDIGDKIASDIEVIGGSYFTEKLDHAPGILTANSALIVDDNKEINELFIGNLSVSGSFLFSGDLSLGSIFANTAIFSDLVIENEIPELFIGNLAVSGNTETLNLDVQGNTVLDKLIVNKEIQELTVSQLSVTGIFQSDNITSNTVNVLGNLNVIGSITNLFSEELNIADNIILLNSNLPDTSSPTQDSGFSVNRGSSNNVSFLWDETLDKWSVGTEDFVAQNFVGELLGNSATTTRLITPITIQLANTVTGSVLFDGSENITIETQIDVLNGGTY